MKIGILSDIHGNDIALKCVLEKARELGVTKLLILGDFVGYYYRPDKVLQLLGDWEFEAIQGNHEGMLLSAWSDSSQIEKITKKYGQGLKFAVEKLNSEQVQFLVNLPTSKKINIDGVQFELCHGSPWDRDVYIYPNAKKELFSKCTASTSNFVLMGHTHYPFISYRNNTVIANVGSVGQARDQGGLASWVLVDTILQTLIFQHTPYDPSEIISEVKFVDPQVPYLHEVLLRG